MLQRSNKLTLIKDTGSESFCNDLISYCQILRGKLLNIVKCFIVEKYSVKGSILNISKSSTLDVFKSETVNQISIWNVVI